jgi:hypothetical protein
MQPDDSRTTYRRFVTISAGTSGLVLGAAAGSFAVLAQSPWPLGFLVALLAFRAVAARRVYPHLARLRRWWAMPMVALASGVLFALTPHDVAPFVLGAAVAGLILWIVAYGVLETRFDPRGEHGGGWL